MTPRRLVAVAVAAMLSACSDGGGPPNASEPSGEYLLTLVGSSPLPYRVGGPYIDFSYIDRVGGSLKVLSRARLVAASVDHHFNRDGSLREETVDSVVFEFRRVGNVVELKFENQLGVRFDTLDLITYLDRPGLRARTMRYFRPGFQDPILAGALYVKQP